MLDNYLCVFVSQLLGTWKKVCSCDYISKEVTASTQV